MHMQTHALARHVKRRITGTSNKVSPGEQAPAASAVSAEPATAAMPGRPSPGRTGATAHNPGLRETAFAGSDVVESSGRAATKAATPERSGGDGCCGLCSTVLSACAGQDDVNGAEFWLDWASAGGDADRYVKEAMPNYAITASLLITMTFPFALEAPEHVREYSAEVAQTFTGVMTLATILCVFVIIVTLTVYQQYCCTIDEETGLNFAANYGYLVPMMQTVLLTLIALFLTGMSLAVVSQDYGTSDERDDIFFGVLAAVGLTTMIATFWLSWDMPRWNQKCNYKKVMDARVAAAKKVVKLQMPKLAELIRSSVSRSEGDHAEADKIVATLTSHGCGDSADLVHYMQSFVNVDKRKELGAFAKTLELLGVKPFHALRIAERIGIVTLTHHEREAARHVAPLVAVPSV